MSFTTLDVTAANDDTIRHKTQETVVSNTAVEDFSVWNVVVIEVGSIMMMICFGVCSRIDDCRRLWLDEL